MPVLEMFVVPCAGVNRAQITAGVMRWPREMNVVENYGIFWSTVVVSEQTLAGPRGHWSRSPARFLSFDVQVVGCVANQRGGHIC